jgi:hypothetical protein
MPTEQFVIDLAVGGFAPQVGKSRRSPSRLAILADRTTMPVLQILAEARFGKNYRREYQFPRWKDGDLTNEMLSNVELIERDSPGAKIIKKVDPPSGTPGSIPDLLKVSLNKSIATL